MLEKPITYRNDPSCQLYHWGVDIQEGDAPISRGIIRDWVPRSGLIVDFLHPGHHADLIPFRKIVGVSCCHRRQYETGDAVETIVQRSSDQPWRWYPSKVLLTDYSRNSDSYAFVEIDYGDGLVREVMAPDRVRLSHRPPFRRCWRCLDLHKVVTGIRALGKRLHQHVVELPDEPALLTVTKKDGFLRIWEREAKVTGAKFKIIRDRLAYISCSKTPISEGNMKKCLRRICGMYQAPLAASPLPPSVTMESEKVNALPHELIGEVLSFLDMNDQLKCQRVCHAWNFFSFFKRLLVHIDLTKYSSVRHYKLIVTLHKTVTSDTRTLVLSASNMQANRGLVEAAHLLEAMGSMVSTIMLFERSPVAAMMDFGPVGSTGRLACAKFAQISKEVLWRRVVQVTAPMVFQFKKNDGEFGKRTEVSMHQCSPKLSSASRVNSTKGPS